MADKLHFSLVSPERELFSGEVDHVVVPGAEGQFGVLARHAPVMAVIKPGALRVIDGATETRIYVGGGFADVSPMGLTVLAEDAVDLSTLDRAQLEADLKDAQEDLRDAKDEAHRARAEAAVARLEAIRAAAA